MAPMRGRVTIWRNRNAVRTGRSTGPKNKGTYSTPSRTTGRGQLEALAHQYLRREAHQLSLMLLGCGYSLEHKATNIFEFLWGNVSAAKGVLGMLRYLPVQDK